MGGGPMPAKCCPRSAALLVAAALIGTGSLAIAGGSRTDSCKGPGAPVATQTRCLTAVQIPGEPLLSFDISWVDPDRAEYYLSDRSNSGIDVIDTESNTFKRTI